MKNMKRIIMMIAVLLVCFNLSAQQIKELTILHTNDTHSRIEPINKNSAKKEQADKGGFVRRATYVAQIRANTPDLLLFDCGDFSQGTPYYNLFKGEVEVKLMNEMGYDAGTIGNHEFDFGLENMARLFNIAKYPIVCANYDVKGTVLEGIVKPYTIIKRNGLKIGVFGVSPKMDGLVQADKCQGLVYHKADGVANTIATYLKEKERCDVVICLSHLGWKGSVNNPESDEKLAANTRNIDLILGGHSHSLIDSPVSYTNLDGKKVTVTQMGGNGLYVGRIDMKFQKK